MLSTSALQSPLRALGVLSLLVLGPIVVPEPATAWGVLFPVRAQESTPVWVHGSGGWPLPRREAGNGQEPAGRIPGPGMSSVPLGARAPAWTETELADTAVRVPRPTHWKKGLVIGGATGAMGLGFMVYGLCEGLKETDGSCVGPGLGGAALGAVTGGLIGALIGGQFPKRSVPESATDSTTAHE